MVKQIALVFSFLLAANISHASVIYDINHDKGQVYMGATVSAMIAYDADTDHFSGLFDGAIFGVNTGGVSSPTVDYRLSGTFSLDAMINGDGNMSGGSVSWTGGGDGIGAGTSLLEGNLIDFGYLLPSDVLSPDLPPSHFRSFDFIIETTSSESLLNLSDFLYLRLYFSEGGDVNPFQTSFINDGPYTGQDLWSLNTRVPEPVSIILLGIGLVGIAFTRCNKN